MLKKLFSPDKHGDTPAGLAVAALAIVTFVVAIGSFTTY